MKQHFTRDLAVAFCALNSLQYFAARPAQAEEAPAWVTSLTYTADVTGALQGGAQQAGRFLDNIDAIADGDLDKLLGLPDTKVHVYLLNNSGGRPNDLVDTLQGVDNIEVAQPRLRLYEAWVQHDFGHGASVLAGLYNLNSEFYTTDASGLLMAPPFGIGSELASTGPNGPSIFPLTALAVRFKVGEDKGAYAEAAVLNARAGVLNDLDRAQLGMDRGALMIGEAGWRGRARIAVGLWGYSREQDDIRDTLADGSPRSRPSHGTYLLAEGALKEAGEGTGMSMFLRAGASDGDTSPYEGGWQSGLRFDHLFAARPDSALSIGVQEAFLSRKQRDNGRDLGLDVGSTESGMEIVYSDTFGPVTVRPDLQVILHPQGDRNRPTAVAGGLRLIVKLK